jgi:hypothetical protein
LARSRRCPSVPSLSLVCNAFVTRLWYRRQPHHSRPPPRRQATSPPHLPPRGNRNQRPSAGGFGRDGRGLAQASVSSSRSSASPHIGRDMPAALADRQPEGIKGDRILRNKRRLRLLRARPETGTCGIGLLGNKRGHIPHGSRLRPRLARRQRREQINLELLPRAHANCSSQVLPTPSGRHFPRIKTVSNWWGEEPSLRA